MRHKLQLIEDLSPNFLLLQFLSGFTKFRLSFSVGLLKSSKRYFLWMHILLRNENASFGNLLTEVELFLEAT